jgi:hypothetical protein
MNASPSSNDLHRQAESLPGGRPTPRKGKGLSRFTWLAIGAGLLAAVVIAAILAFTRSAAPSVSHSIAGTWVGTGTVSAGGPSGPIAYYLDLTTGANHRITGIGRGCTKGPDRLFVAILTITGAPAASDGAYTMDWTTSDLGPTERTLHVSAHVSGSQMTISGSDPSTTPPTTSSATLTRGSQSDFNVKCNSLPTPAPSSCDLTL